MEMDAGFRLRRARTARGVKDLDRDALRRRQAQDALESRSEDDEKKGPKGPKGPKSPKSPDSPNSPGTPKSSTAPPPQATAPPAQATPPPARETDLLPAPPPPPPPPSRPGNQNPPPPPPQAPLLSTSSTSSASSTSSTSSTTSQRPNPPVTTVPLPTPPSRTPPALTISTQPAQATNSPPSAPSSDRLPPPVQNPVDVSSSRPSNPPVTTVPLPGSSTSQTTMVVSVVPTPSPDAPSSTSLPFRETAIAIQTSTRSSASAPVTTAGPQFQLGPTASASGRPLTSIVDSGVSEPQPTDSAASPVAAPARAGDGGAGLHAGIAVGSVAGTAFFSALMFYGYKVYKRRQDSDYLSKPYTSGSFGSRDAPAGGSVAVVTGVPVAAGTAMGMPGTTGATIDPKTNSQIMNDVFAAVYAAENGQAGIYGSEYNSMASAEYPAEKKMEVQREQYQGQEQDFQTQEQGGRGTIASWIRGTKTPTSPTRTSWTSRFTAPSWARSSTGSTIRASAPFPEGFRPASPLPPVPALPATGTYNTGNGDLDSVDPLVNVPAPPANPNAGMVSRWSDSTRQTPPSPSTVRQSEAMSYGSVYSMYQQRNSETDIPPMPSTSSQYHPFGPGVRRPSATLQKLRTNSDVEPTPSENSDLDFEVSPLSPESEAVTNHLTVASPASYKVPADGWGGQ
ncbi:hypothetical protein RB594_000176 [Gaeumannomyces avenae]